MLEKSRDDVMSDNHWDLQLDTRFMEPWRSCETKWEKKKHYCGVSLDFRGRKLIQNNCNKTVNISQITLVFVKWTEWHVDIAIVFFPSSSMLFMLWILVHFVRMYYFIFICTSVKAYFCIQGIIQGIIQVVHSRPTVYYILLSIYQSPHIISLSPLTKSYTIITANTCSVRHQSEAICHPPWDISSPVLRL